MVQAVDSTVGLAGMGWDTWLQRLLAPIKRRKGGHSPLLIKFTVYFCKQVPKTTVYKVLLEL